MHYFKDREEWKETQIRQENHFTIINKNGVVDDGKTLVGLRKKNHMGKIYFIRRLPKKYGGNIEDSSQDMSDQSSIKSRKSINSDADRLQAPEVQFNESSNQIFESQIMGEDERMLDNEMKSEHSMDSDINNLNMNTNEDDGKIMLSERNLGDSPNQRDLRVSKPIKEDTKEDVSDEEEEGIFDSKPPSKSKTPKEETKIDVDSESDSGNEIPAIANPPSKGQSSKKVDLIAQAQEDSDSSEGNEIEAVPEKGSDWTPQQKLSELTEEGKGPLNIDAVFGNDNPAEEEEQRKQRIEQLSSSSEGNEIEAVPQAKQESQPEPKKDIEELSSSSDGNEIEAVANSPAPIEEPIAPPPKKKKKRSKKKKRIRPDEDLSDDD